MASNTQGDMFDGYPPGFFHWLPKNQHIYDAFVDNAIRMTRRRSHYSARTIVEVLRWNTDLRDRDKTFKINDHWTPGMARLFMQEYPHHNGFFRLR